MRPAEARARCPSMISMPSIWNGGCSITIQKLKLSMAPTSSSSWITR